VPLQGDGEGEIWLDTRSAGLNPFGDVVQRNGNEPNSIRVELKFLATSTGETTFRAMPPRDSQASVGFRLYDVVFPGDALHGSLQLVLGTTNRGPHRLLVYRGALPVKGRAPEEPTHIVPLHGSPAITSLLPDGPLNHEVDLSGYYTAGDGGLHMLRVNGTLGEAGRVAFDPNYITFDAFGEPMFFTLMGFWPDEVTLEQSEIPDPTGQGRTLYRAVPARPQNTNQVTLVLGETETGPHRIVVYSGDRAMFVIHATLSERRRQEAASSLYASLSSREQEAIADLRRAVGYGFQCTIKQERAVGLTFTGNNGRLPPAGVLARLANLREIFFYGGHFPAACLGDLVQLQQLRSLFFSGSELQPASLAMLEDLRQLENLGFYMCEGINDEGVKHVAGLTGLQWLRIYHEAILRGPPEPRQCVTDAGFAHLEKLINLQELDLFGQDLSDTSVKVLTGMTELRELALSGHGFTDAGLDGLAQLPNLRSLRLFETGVSTNGVAALKTRLPKLRIEAWGREPRH
jgi:hypothetical protein